MKIYLLKLLYQILFTKIDEEPHSSEYTVIVKNDKNDTLEPLAYFISTLQDKKEMLDECRIRWHRGMPS